MTVNPVGTGTTSPVETGKNPVAKKPAEIKIPIGGEFTINQGDTMTGRLDNYYEELITGNPVLAKNDPSILVNIADQTVIDGCNDGIQAEKAYKKYGGNISDWVQAGKKCKTLDIVEVPEQQADGSVITRTFVRRDKAEEYRKQFGITLQGKGETPASVVKPEGTVTNGNPFATAAPAAAVPPAEPAATPAAEPAAAPAATTPAAPPEPVAEPVAPPDPPAAAATVPAPDENERIVDPGVVPNPANEAANLEAQAGRPAAVDPNATSIMDPKNPTNIAVTKGSYGNSGFAKLFNIED